MKIEWIDNASMLEQHVARWLKLPAISMDTEFEHRRTFYPRPALLQIYDGENAYLVDLPRLGETGLLGELLKAPGLLKIFHSARQDLVVLWCLCHEIVRPIFDVQIAAMLTGDKTQCAYQTLVKQRLDIDLAKTETVSDWLRRPLTTQQLHYAADDVRYLPDLHERYTVALKELNRLDWMREDCDCLCDSVELFVRADTWSPPLRFPRLHKLAPEVRAIVRTVGTWRETEARRRDLPRTWIVQDKELARIASRQPTNTHQLIDWCGMDKRRAKRYGKDVLKCIRDLQILPEDQNAVAVSMREENMLVDAARAREEVLGLTDGALLYRTEAHLVLSAYKNGTRTDGRAGCPWRADIFSEILSHSVDREV